ncbi:MAG: MoxR family ATPase [Fimbriimonadaceae bacterium]|nr:MoxR family ATPase [Fimbriimonadaceae bacterium]
MEINAIAPRANDMIAEVERVIVGKRETVTQAVLTMLCGGHLLLEDIPGVGKTTLAKSLARTIGGIFRRVQFTPDLLPSDVTGSSIFNQKTAEFEFRPGPIFGNVVLADEINRATPKTQSSLLEAMEEHQVSIDGEPRMLPTPFFVIATQNNLEMTGTYPLPEAQLDRFFARLSIGYPDRQSEVAVLDAQQRLHPVDSVQAIVSLEELLEMQAAVRTVYVSPRIQEYVVDVVRATRESNQLVMGASPRGSLHLMRAAQASAAMDGRTQVAPEDVKRLANAVLGHRIITRAEMRSQGMGSDAVMARILDVVPAPVPIG